MSIIRALKEQVNNFYVYLLENGHVAICNAEGQCVASTDLGKIGLKLLKVDRIKKNIGTNIVNLNKDLNSFLVFNKDKSDLLGQKEEERIKNLADFALQQYLKANRISEDTIDRFFTRILNSRLDGENVLRFELEAKSLGLNFNMRRTAVVISFNNFEHNLLYDSQSSLDINETIQQFKRKIVDTINGFFTKNNNLIVAYIGGGKFVLFKAMTSLEEESFIRYMKKAFKTIFEPLKDQRQGELTVGFGNAHGGLLGLIESFKEADRALELGQKMGRGKEEGFYYGDFHELRILTEENNQKKVSYANELIGLLNDNPSLKETLEIFFEEDLSITNTALRLKLHPNTIIYRLRRIKDIIGFDPRIFEEATAIKIALLTNKLLS